MFRDQGRFASALGALERREFAAAEAAFSEFLAQLALESGERAFLLNKRGVARIGLERRDRARDDFIAALETRPAFAPALTNLGNLLLDEGDVEGAIGRYESAIAADRDYALAYFNVSVAYKRTGRFAEAVRALRQAQRIEQRANAASSWRRARPR
ncbi:MAG TPA: tetratricopeptide repeat protein [Candidatus Nitrosotalea sp.]|nr:tetratricopeptide repeat protein [Candidatus Nitrosotalea sp.]